MEKESQLNNNPNPEIWTFEIPDVHPSLNVWSKMNRWKMNTLKKQWEHDVFYLAKQAKIPFFNFPVDIFITYHHPRQTVDKDNFSPKFIMDGLKPFLIDDNIKIVKKLDWDFVKSDKKKSIIEIRRFSE